MERSASILRFNSELIVNYVKALDSQPVVRDTALTPNVFDYRTSNTSEIVLNSILSYTDFVNRTSYLK